MGKNHSTSDEGSKINLSNLVRKTLKTIHDANDVGPSNKKFIELELNPLPDSPDDIAAETITVDTKTWPQLAGVVYLSVITFPGYDQLQDRKDFVDAFLRLKIKDANTRGIIPKESTEHIRVKNKWQNLERARKKLKRFEIKWSYPRANVAQLVYRALSEVTTANTEDRKPSKYQLNDIWDRERDRSKFSRDIWSPSIPAVHLSFVLWMQFGPVTDVFNLIDNSEQWVSKCIDEANEWRYVFHEVDIASLDSTIYLNSK